MRVRRSAAALVVLGLVVGRAARADDGATASASWAPHVGLSASYVSEMVRPGARLAADVGIIGTVRRGYVHELYAGPLVGVTVYPQVYALTWIGAGFGYRLVSPRAALFELFADLAVGIRTNWGETLRFGPDGTLEPTGGARAAFTPTFGWAAGQDFSRRADPRPFAWFFRMSAMVRPHNDVVGAVVLFELGVRWSPRVPRR